MLDSSGAIGYNLIYWMGASLFYSGISHGPATLKQNVIKPL